METENSNETQPGPTPLPPPAGTLAAKVVGVGTAGLNILDHALRGGLPGVQFAAIHTDERALAASSAPEKIHLESKLLKGFGTGGDRERGRELAIEQRPGLERLCTGMGVVFIVAGLGGGAGTGITPVLARIAREAGAFVVGFVVTPFDCEGKSRSRAAMEGLRELQEAADTVICFPNQSVFKLVDENNPAREALKVCNDYVVEGLRGIWLLLTRPGLLEIPFAELKTILTGHHADNLVVASEAAGPTRSREAADKLLSHPMLNGGSVLADADVVVANLVGGPDLTMAEIRRVMEQLGAQCPEAAVRLGAAVDETMPERLMLTLIAARKVEEPEFESDRAAAENPAAALLSADSPPRSSSRLRPPLPPLSADKVKEAMRTLPGGGGRRGSKLRQGQLELQIVSKGRFEKSEPTIYRGEDLDMPTYLRRGIALN